MRKSWRYYGFIFTLLFLAPVLAAQSRINTRALLHDSRSDLFRTPGGAVTLGTTVLLRFRAAVGDLDSVGIRVWNTREQAATVVPMSVVNTTPEGYDLWQASVDVGEETTVLWYRFILTKGGQTLFYEDDTRPDGENYFAANEGGVGTFYDQSPDLSYQISVYDPDFYTPEWFRNAIVYQIFPDRFRDGDPSNDPEDGSDIFYGNLPLVFHERWNEPPLDFHKVDAPEGGPYVNSDFFGGDLAGISEELDYLQELGITAIYLNPIFEARSNHRYDTADYLTIDPILGDLDDFRTLVREARVRGIHIILDGVFNHMSSDSRYFDRYGRFDDVGACESVDSPYRAWFFFVAPQPSQPSPCEGGEDGLTNYVSWAGVDTIPKINNDIYATRSFFFQGDDSVVATWGAEGIGGWRLDVAGEIDNGSDPDNTYWERFRRAVREIDPEAIIIGEEWNDASEWLLGDEWDTVMNYRFRRAIIGVVRGDDFVDNDGLISGLTVSQFDGLVRSVEEDYPPMAYHAMMNLLDSHDTTRLLFAVGNHQNDQRLAAFVQYALPGAPTIYYADEVGLNAPSAPEPGGDLLQDDPYNRAPYPWPDESGYYEADDAMLDYYRTLSEWRSENLAIHEGEMMTLVADDDKGLYIFLRIDAEHNSAVLVAVNVSQERQTAVLNFAGLLPNDLILYPYTDLDTIDTSSGSAFIGIPGRTGVIWRPYAEADFTKLESPSNLTADSQSGQVTLSWDAVDDASGYLVYRSPVAVGGFEPITDEPMNETSFTDESVADGFAYYYAVASVRDNGVYGDLGDSLLAVPSVDIGDVAYFGDTHPTVTLAYGVSVDLQAAILVEGLTDVNGPADGIRAQIGEILANGDFDEDTLIDMHFIEDQGGADVYSASFSPQHAGTYSLAARFSTDAGQTWTTVTLVDGSYPVLTVESPDDITAPDAPASITVERASVSGVELSWEVVDDDSLAAYRLYRVGDTGDLLIELPPDTTQYTDYAVLDGQRFDYYVTAVDMALNESQPAYAPLVLVERQLIPVTFLVEVPPTTNSDVYIAGDFGTEQLPLWDSAGAGMMLTQVDDTHWAITLNLPEGAALQYKFVRGTWDAVEKGTDCEEIANRTLSVNIDSLGELSTDIVPDGSYIVLDTVAKWRDLDDCG